MRDSTDPVAVPLVLITAAVAFIVTLPLVGAYAAVAALVAAAAAAIVGAPALILARKMGLRGLWATVALGGVVPAFLGAMGEGVARLRFQRLEGDAMLYAYVGVFVGAAAGGIYSTIFDQHTLSPAAVRRRVLFILALAVVLPLVSLWILSRRS